MHGQRQSEDAAPTMPIFFFTGAFIAGRIPSSGQPRISSGRSVAGTPDRKGVAAPLLTGLARRAFRRPGASGCPQRHTWPTGGPGSRRRVRTASHRGHDGPHADHGKLAEFHPRADDAAGADGDAAAHDGLQGLLRRLRRFHREVAGLEGPGYWSLVKIVPAAIMTPSSIVTPVQMYT